MVTDEKLTVYQRYGGDVDGWVRAATPRQRALMTDADWAAISEVLFRLAVVKSGQADSAYETETRRLVDAIVENESVSTRLMDCA